MYSDGGRGRGFGSRGRGTRSFGFSRDRDSEDRRQYSRQNFGDRRDTESDESHGGSSSIYVPKSKVGMIIGNIVHLNSAITFARKARGQF